MRATITTMAAGLASVLAAAMPAAAGDFSLRLGIGLGARGGLGLAINTGCTRPAVAVAPVQRVWVPTVQTRYRDVPVIDACGQVVAYRRQAYTVTGGYWKAVHRPVAVRGGHGVASPTPVRVSHGVTAGSIRLNRPRTGVARMAAPPGRPTVRVPSIRRRVGPAAS